MTYSLVYPALGQQTRSSVDHHNGYESMRIIKLSKFKFIIGAFSIDPKDQLERGSGELAAIRAFYWRIFQRNSSKKSFGTKRCLVSETLRDSQNLQVRSGLLIEFWNAHSVQSLDAEIYFIKLRQTLSDERSACRSSRGQMRMPVYWNVSRNFLVELDHQTFDQRWATFLDMNNLSQHQQPASWEVSLSTI